MANPTFIDRELTILAAATGERSVGLNAAREYSVINLAKGEDGSAVEVDIYIATSLSPTLNAASGAEKFLLAPNRVVVLGPGVSMLRFKSASGAPTLGVVPAPFDRMAARG